VNRQGICKSNPRIILRKSLGKKTVLSQLYCKLIYSQKLTHPKIRPNVREPPTQMKTVPFVCLSMRRLSPSCLQDSPKELGVLQLYASSKSALGKPAMDMG